MGFAPPPYDGFALLASATHGCAYLATNTSYIGLQPHAIKAWRNFGESPKGEVRRIPLPRTSVNKGKKKARGVRDAQDFFEYPG